MVGVMTSSVISADGTRIGFEVRGVGPGLILLHGGTADRTRWAQVAPILAERFTLYLVDRRGRGLSGDGPEAAYTIEREAEDLLAVAEAAAGANGLVHLLGHSYGALITLETLPRGGPFDRVVLYEPPFRTNGLAVFPSGVLDTMAERLAADDRDGVLAAFFRGAIGLDEAAVDAQRRTPMWPARLAAAHTIVREGRVADTYRPRPELSRLTVPVRFLLGTDSPEYVRAATRAAHRTVPGSDILDLPGQAHMAMDTIPEKFAGVVTDFLLS